LSDGNIPECGQVGDRERDRTNKVGDAGEKEEVEGREVSDGRRKRDGLREVKVGEIKVSDTVGWSEVVAIYT
jgi:hypothetical protein